MGRARSTIDPPHTRLPGRRRTDTVRAAVGCATVGLALWIASGCGRGAETGGSSHTAESATTSPATTGPHGRATLLEVDRHGGLCASGRMCQVHITIRRDGTWQRDTLHDSERGTVPAPELDRLTSAIDVGVDSLDTLPTHDHGCPEHADGTTVNYRFTARTLADPTVPRTVVVSNCDRVLDPGNPVIAATDAALSTLP